MGDETASRLRGIPGMKKDQAKRGWREWLGLRPARKQLSQSGPRNANDRKPPMRCGTPYLMAGMAVIPDKERDQAT